MAKDTKQAGDKESRLHKKAGAVRKESRPPRGKVLTRKDGVFSLVGIGVSKAPGGISEKKHDY